MSERMTAKLAYDALKMALQRRKKPRGIIVHTDPRTDWILNSVQPEISLMEGNGFFDGCLVDPILACRRSHVRVAERDTK